MAQIPEMAAPGDRRVARYGWLASGDVNAFFGLMLDNLSDMILMAGLLINAYGFPSEFVLTRMIPGTAIGVLVGDVLYTVMAFRLARRTGKTDVTAMPLGLDTPSTFGAVFLVLGPAFQHAQLIGGATANPMASAEHAWYVGISVLLISGIFKILCAPLSAQIRRVMPRAGLLGSLVAIALVLISFLPLLELAATPVVGMVTLTVILATLTARWELAGKSALWLVVAGIFSVAVYLLRLPPSVANLFPALAIAAAIAGSVGFCLYRNREVPGALMAVVLGSAVFYLMNASGLGPAPDPRPDQWMVGLPPFPVSAWLQWFPDHWSEVIGYLPVALPLALGTVIGGIDCAESASAAGDDYPTSHIVAAEGVATLVGGLFGGVIQSTPYIGHPAYKAMGGRAGYTLATALFVGLAGVLGVFGWIFHVLPRAAVYPILVFVGLEIAQQSFRATSRRHYPALVIACVPALAYLAYLMVDRLNGEVDRVFGQGGATVLSFQPAIREWLQILTVLSGGFLITGLLWGTALTKLIDGRWGESAGIFALGSVFSLFGVMHSPLKGSPLGWPWWVISELERTGRFPEATYQTPYHWAAAYAASALTVVLIGCSGSRGRLDPDLIPPEPEMSGSG